MPEDVYVGIDVSKDYLEVAVDTEGRSRRFPNTAAGIRDLVQRLQSLVVVLIVVEATGGYERALANALDAAGLALAVVNPRQIRGFANSLGVLAKTDAIDARVIARFGAAVKPPARKRNDRRIYDLAALVSRRSQLTSMRTAERNRLALTEYPAVRSDLKRAVTGFGRRIQRLDGEIAKLIDASPQLRTRSALLLSVPGVGPHLAAALIAYLPELGSIGNRQVCALAGVAPLNRDSGNFSGKRYIWGGRAAVRTALYMGAVTAAHHNADIKPLYDRLVAAGKPKKLALVACMRKLLTILNAMVRHGEYWRDQSAARGGE